MDDEVCFIIPGDPKAKSRPRVTKQGRAYTPKTTADAEEAVREIVRALNIEPYTCKVGLEISFFCKTLRRTDGDNLLKLILDACNELLYVDDYLVEDVHYHVYRKFEGEEPRTEVLAFPLDD